MVLLQLRMDTLPCHCNYDRDGCCGIFNAVKEGEMSCNECGMTITELLESQAVY